MGTRAARATACAALGALLACGGDGVLGPQGPDGPAGPSGQDGQDGAEGPPGPAGADVDSNVRLFGDGSDGALTVAAGESVALEGSQYTTITIGSGATLVVSSGTLLRATGNVRNDGTIRVRPAALSGIRAFDNSPPADQQPILAPPHPGVGLSGAQFGSYDNGSPLVAYGGRGGEGIRGAARWLTTLLPYAGGGGATSWPFTAQTRPSGGGSFHLRSGGEIRNAGTIEANGAITDSFSFSCGHGGGGGGAILIAAAVAIDGGGGTISAQGSDGLEGIDQCGAGGGGGGGFVHLIAPAIDPGTVAVAGGAAGAPSTWTSVLRWIGGRGGGGSAGNGGRGGGRKDSTSQEATGGEAGQTFVLEAAPRTIL